MIEKSFKDYKLQNSENLSKIDSL